MKLSVRRLVIIGMLGAISIVLGLTPLGFIPIPFSPIRATIMHIPVIIGTIMEGPLVGLCVAFIFGGTSMYQAATNPTPVSFVFLDPLVAIVPRLLIAIISHYAYTGMKSVLSKKDEKTAIRVSSGLAAGLGTLTNTVGVLGMIYLRHAAQYGEALGIGSEGVGAFLLGVGATNGIPEIIVAILIVVPVIGALKRLYK
ncbi:MAG TPA: ECF transporter S component [Clostridiales bacterium]|nr:ECF transporter S component [Clostridiales bacterium]